MTGAVYGAAPGYPDLGLQRPVVAGWSIADVAHPAGWAAYLAVVAAYVAAQARKFASGQPLNGSKLLYMGLLVPLHLVAFSHPLVVFLVPLVTVGHNIQYHCIVYSYGRNKYGERSGREYRWASCSSGTLRCMRSSGSSSPSCSTAAPGSSGSAGPSASV
jgi:hypothetical protein